MCKESPRSNEMTDRINSPPTYSYSIQAIDFIVDEIKKDPENIVQNLKNKSSKKMG